MTDERGRKDVTGRMLIASLPPISRSRSLFRCWSDAAALFGLTRRREPTRHTTTSTTAALTIKPLSVRPVVSAFVTTPGKHARRRRRPPPINPCGSATSPSTAVYDAQARGRAGAARVDSFAPTPTVETCRWR